MIPLPIPIHDNAIKDDQMLPALRGLALATVLVLSGATAWGQSDSTDWLSAEQFSAASLTTPAQSLPALTDALSDDEVPLDLGRGLVLNDQHVSASVVRGQCPDSNCVWGWRLLPSDILYSSYLASPIAPRMQSGLLYERENGGSGSSKREHASASFAGDLRREPTPKAGSWTSGERRFPD